MPDLRLFLLIPVAFVALGLLFVWIGVRGQRSVRAFKARAARADGLVTELRRRYSNAGSSGSGGPIFHPVVRFSLPDGREVEAESRFGGNPAPAKQGATVEVLYEPEDPMDFRVAGAWADGTVGNVGLAIFGAVFAGFGLVFLLFAGLIAAG